MRDIFYMGSTSKDIEGFPDEVIEEIAFALSLALGGDRAINIVPLTTFGSSRVHELRSSHNGDAFRLVYSVQFEHAVYVLHAFQKKSKRGRQTPKEDMALIRSRLKGAKEHYDLHYGKAAKRRSNGGDQGR